MMNVATQARNKHFGVCPPVRVKHFISCSYRDLDFLATYLDGITTETCATELANKTHGYDDCCMMSIVEWGHARRYCQRISTTLMTKITWIMLVSLHSG